MKNDEENFATMVDAELKEVADLLKAKNRMYGNSALDPVRIFSKVSRLEQLQVRIDDKLSRLRASTVDDQEDVVLDLLGYLVLLRIARKTGGDGRRAWAS